MKTYEITSKDIKSNYFHFTNLENLESIEKKGLIPSKGSHAKHLEKNKKVFFVEGLDNLLILFDCWITVYTKIPLIHIPYKYASKFLQSKKKSLFITDIYFALIKNSKMHRNFAFKVFDRLLAESVLLNLNIKEGIDFKEDDIDEIKAAGFKKEHLIIMGYSLKYSDMDSNLVDKWNMHTFSGQGVGPDKLKKCSLDGSYDIKSILLFALKNTTIDVENICPVLTRYLKSRNLKWKEN